MPIKLYPGICEQIWNHHPVSPGKNICVSPVYGTGKTKKENRVFVPPEVECVIVDSGAFSDNISERLSFEDALKRQIMHINKYNYWYKVHKLAAYDILIDEKWHNGKRTKQRWSEEGAVFAVNETVNASKYLNEKRYAIPNEAGIIMSLQGVSVKQYIDCANKTIPYFNVDTDWIGLGGWCIVGKMRKRMLPVFVETMRELIPMLSENKVKHAHIWGVIFPEALGYLLYLCNQHNIELSTDSVGPQLKPCFGAWGYGDWTNNNYSRPDVSIRGLERKRHLEITINWLNDFENTQYYKPLPPKQYHMEEYKKW